MTVWLWLCSAAVAGGAVLLVRRRFLAPFLFSAILGLLCGVAAVCVAPALSLRFSLNAFTGTVCVLLGPAGAAGLLMLSFLWEL